MICAQDENSTSAGVQLVFFMVSLPFCATWRFAWLCHGPVRLATATALLNQPRPQLRNKFWFNRFCNLLTNNQIGGPPWRRHQGVTAQPRHLQKQWKIQHTVEILVFGRMFWGSKFTHFCASVRPSVRPCVQRAGGRPSRYKSWLAFFGGPNIQISVLILFMRSPPKMHGHADINRKRLFFNAIF